MTLCIIIILFSNTANCAVKQIQHQQRECNLNRKGLDINEIRFSNETLLQSNPTSKSSAITRPQNNQKAECTERQRRIHDAAAGNPGPLGVRLRSPREE